MHRVVDSQGGLYLDAEALAGAGFAPGRPVHVRMEAGQLVLSTEPVIRLRERPAATEIVAAEAWTA